MISTDYTLNFYHILKELIIRVIETNQFTAATDLVNAKIEPIKANMVKVTYRFYHALNYLELTVERENDEYTIKIENYTKHLKNHHADLYLKSSLLLERIGGEEMNHVGEAITLKYTPQTIQAPRLETRLGALAPAPIQAKKKQRRNLESVAFITSMEEKCGINTYTKFLSEAMRNSPATSLEGTIKGLQFSPSIIHSQVEFGVFPNKEMILEGNIDRHKIVTWHTVYVDPGPLLDYYQSVDQEYDAHIVHSVLAKRHMSRYVGNPIYIIPHGTLIFETMDKSEARKKLDLPLDAQIAFAFGFWANNKGFSELLSMAERLGEEFPRLKLIISGAIHGKVGDIGRKGLEDLKGMAGKSSIILGRFLSEEEIDLYLSASDLLIFNYEDNPNVVSASGALHRCLASGRPIVCSDVPRMGDLEDGRHALKYRPHEVKELKRCLSLVLEDSQLADTLSKNARTLAEETSWDRVAQRHIEIYRMVLTEGHLYGPEYYDESYFDTASKPYRTPDGQIHRWGYCKSSEVNWEGWQHVVDGLKAVFSPERVLDAGTGTGGLVHYLLEGEVEAIGFDFSSYACQHPFKRARGAILRADAKHIPFKDRSFDLVTVCDLLEHIYEDDLDHVIGDIQRLSKRHIFYNIGSVTRESKDYYVLEKGKLPSIQWEATSVSGHVNVRPPSYWRSKLEGKGWKLRDDLEMAFRQKVPQEVLANWQLILVAEREG